MGTVQRAYSILSAAPDDAMRDVAGLAALALIVFSGFLLPAIL